ncbi:MAG: uroporphyrinogen-III synthase [Bacteroidetes bacterium]|nr:MAG: uroporphyrinogen-III synthase [Bacteroidota bacterium]
MKISKLLIAQPEPTHKHNVFQRVAEKTGVEMTFQPFIKVEGVSTYDFRKQKIDYAKFPCVILTSRTAIDHYFRLAEEIRYTVPETTRYFCLSEQIALYLQKYIVYRKRKIVFAEDGQLDTLINMMGRYKSERFLIPLSEQHKPEVPRELRRAGIKATKCIMFRTQSQPLDSIAIEDYDMLVFYSPHDIKSLQENFPEYEQSNQAIAAWGKKTHTAAKSAGLELQIAMPTTKCRSMTEALEAYIVENNV